MREGAAHLRREKTVTAVMAGMVGAMAVEVAAAMATAADMEVEEAVSGLHHRRAIGGEGRGRREAGMEAGMEEVDMGEGGAGGLTRSMACCCCRHLF